MAYKWILNGVKTVGTTPLMVSRIYDTKRWAERDRDKYEQDEYVVTIGQRKKIVDE